MSHGLFRRAHSQGRGGSLESPEWMIGDTRGSDQWQPAPSAHLCVPAVVATVPVSIAARVMARRRVDSLVVLDEGRACGVLTALNLVNAATLSGRSAAEVSVADVCSRELADLIAPEPVLVESGDTIVDAARVMIEASAGAAIVMDDAAVSGVITGQDLAAATAQTDDAIRATVDEVSVRVDPLSLADDIEQAVQRVGTALGRPVPVVDHADPVGTVRLPLAWRASA